jgi:transposase
VVIMNNLAAHRATGIREAIEAAGAQLRYLPLYSPDFNPIEDALSKLNPLLSKTAARIIDGFVGQRPRCNPAVYARRVRQLLHRSRI